MKKARFSGKNVLITGGSSGIGLEIAIAFGRWGANLFLVARNKARLDEAEKKIKDRLLGTEVQVNTFQADVSVREQIEAVIHQVGNEDGGLHTLINNAGIFLPGLVEDNTLEDLEHIMRVNYFGMLYATKAAWPYLKAAQNGHLGFVSSVAGYTGMIGYGAYAPTKFAIAGLVECLRMEAADHRIGVTIVFPPDTDTPQLHYENANALPECLALKQSTQVMKPEVVAQKFVDGIVNYQFEVLCNFESRFIRWVKAMWPGLYFKILDNIVAKDRRKRRVVEQRKLESEI
jgi:3-dehydrosphinganine reductase